MESFIFQQENGLPGVAFGQVIEFISIFFFSSLRVGAFLLAAPFFGTPSIPLQVRIATAMILSIAYLDQIDPTIVLNAGLFDFIKITFVELFIGICVGLFMSILFSAVALAGEKIAASGGLGFAAQVDPTSGGQTPVISNIMTLFLIVIFGCTGSSPRYPGTTFTNLSATAASLAFRHFVIFWNFGGFQTFGGVPKLGIHRNS